MAVKLSSLAFLRKIPNWVHLSAYVSSVAGATNIQIIPENDQIPPTNTEFEAKIQFLKNKLHPDSLIRVLDSTIDLNSSLKLFKWASLQNRFRHTSDTYYTIILKMGMAGNVEEVECFSNELVKERCPGAEEALMALINSFVEHCRLNEALRVLVTMNSGSYKPPIAVFNVLLGALVEEKSEFQSVLFVYKEMVKAGIVPNIETLNCLLEALFEAGRVDTALDQYGRMKKKRCTPDSRTFEILISGLLARNRVDESVVILGEMFELGAKLDSSSYTTMIPLFCRENKLEEGIKLFRMMRACKIMPDTLIYEVLIQSLCENQRVADAIIILEDMIDNNATPADAVLVNIINGLCKLEKFNEAMNFLEDNHIFQTYPHNVLLEGYCSAGNFLAAKGLFDKMLVRNIADSTSWNILIRWLAENSLINKGFQFLSRMIISSYVPDSATFSALVVGKCKMSKHKDALELFHQVCAKYWVLDPVSYAELVECLCCWEYIQEAAEVCCYMSTNKCALQSSSLGMLIKGLCVSGKTDKAIRLLSLSYHSGTYCSNTAYNTIMLGLSKSEKATDLSVVLSQMLVAGCTLDMEAYCILIKSMSALGRTKDCALYFNMMISDGLLPNSQTLANLLSCLANHSQLHIILPAIDKLVSDYEILNSEIYNILVNGLWKEGHKSEACQLLDLMLEKGWVPDATTHGLLVGSVRKETGSEIAASESYIAQDKISSILAESLDKM